MIGARFTDFWRTIADPWRGTVTFFLVFEGVKADFDPPFVSSYTQSALTGMRPLPREPRPKRGFRELRYLFAKKFLPTF